MNLLSLNLSLSLSFSAFLILFSSIRALKALATAAKDACSPAIRCCCFAAFLSETER